MKIYTHLRACRQISGKDQTNSECGEISPNKRTISSWLIKTTVSSCSGTNNETLNHIIHRLVCYRSIYGGFVQTVATNVLVKARYRIYLLPGYAALFLNRFSQLNESFTNMKIKKCITERVIIELVWSLMCPVDSFADASFILLLEGENASCCDAFWIIHSWFWSFRGIS